MPGHQDWYPPEALDKRPCGPGTDIWMASHCMTSLLNRHAPRELLNFAQGCRQRPLDARPDDAWRLLREFDQVLDRLYGPRTFRPFTLTR
ncbi:hypothetical protein [Micromonospora sp. NPDC023737]|uniref:hypothetical protein n=1 Tax=unclassified Micromonospora TaxID=2617518 RepID=UPI00341026E8